MSGTRVCLDPHVIRLLARDGFGWGHDLDCGCLTLPEDAKRPSLLQRLASKLGMGG
ncbi:MAG: hypothetical protein HLUCCA08_18440 [Rhodobacteraceae bacterium HLUCCA08]|nr:MAG: hypothetical protein HLUCCA08_18440 [Rhodobacteraceae bacterium HLUCCA08]